MSKKIEDVSREQIAQFLPGAIARAMGSYQEFSERDALEVPEGGKEKDPVKNFSAHHTACKVAIAHIDLLLKLARWAELSEDDDFSGLMKEARVELDKYNGGRTEADDE